MNQLPNELKTPAWLQLFQWISDPLGYLENNYQKYGDMFTARIVGLSPFVMVSHPQAIQEIFTTNAQKFDAGRTNGILTSFLGTESIAILDGSTHKRRRKLLMPPFHGERLQTYGQLICNISQKIASQWVQNKPFIMRQVMQDITLEVIIQAIFGLSEGERYQQLKPLLAEMLDSVSSPVRSSFLFLRFLQKDWGNWSPWGQMKRNREKIYDLLQAEIDRRRREGKLEGHDILTLMLLARDEMGNPMTDIELKDELMTLLFAGHETTATGLTWAFYWIHKLPEVKEKVLKEIEGCGDKEDPMKIAKLPYLTAVCQETLRIYPVAMLTFGRVAKSPVEIMGQQFATETMFAPCIYLTHHREDIYPNPKQFRPERFLEREYSPYEYLPFGGGTRLCIGYALAQLEMKLVLATILSNYHLELGDQKPIKPQRRGLTLAPGGGVKMMMTGKRIMKNSKVTELVGT